MLLVLVLVLLLLLLMRALLHPLPRATLLFITATTMEHHWLPIHQH
jgi:hypothetical protein